MACIFLHLGGFERLCCVLAGLPGLSFTSVSPGLAILGACYTAERKLAMAVIQLAIQDARKGDREAAGWLRGPGASLWWALLGVYPSRAMVLLQRVDFATVRLPGEAPPKALVMDALWRHPDMNNRELGRRLDCHYETVRQVRMSLA